MARPGSSGLRPVEQVIEQLQRCGKRVRAQGGGWMAQCPAHDDQKASLSIRAGERGQVLLKCHAGCDWREVLRTLGLTAEALGGGRGGPSIDKGKLSIGNWPLPTTPLSPRTYDYTDADGTLRYRVVRTPDKRFWVEHPMPDGGWEPGRGEAEWVLYRLREVASAPPGSLVFVAEGEKDVESLRLRGFVATTNPGGAGKWREAFCAPLAGKRVVVLPDNDPPGVAHGVAVLASLQQAGVEAARLALPDLPPKGDVSDWLAAGGTRERLLELVEAAFVSSISSISSISSVTAEELEPNPWPAPLGEAAFHGIAGEIVRAIEPETEADVAAVLLSFLAAVGNLIGSGPHAKVGATRHALNLFVGIVGLSSGGRKGTSEDLVCAVLQPLDPEWEKYRIRRGLSTGEGLIKQVRDPVEEQEPDPKSGVLRTVLRDPGEADKRLMLFESELSNMLKVMARRENTLSPVLRLAWDGKTLHTLTRADTQQATGAHVSLVGHIVRDELRQNLTATETANGFGNRFLWVCARRARFLPFGGELPPLERQGERLRQCVQAARRIERVSWGAAARPMWSAVYGALSTGGYGLVGAVTSRAAAQVLRLATLYAVLDGQDEIAPDHLLAALAVWEYCEASARYIFSRRSRLEQRLLDLLQQAPTGLTRHEIREHLGHTSPAEQIATALAALAQAGLVESEKQPGVRGRPAELWRCVEPAVKEEMEEMEETAKTAKTAPAEETEEIEEIEELAEPAPPEAATAADPNACLPGLADAEEEPPSPRWGGV